MFFLDSQPCIDPATTLAECLRLKLPADFSRRANSFGMRLGGEPVVAHLLVRRRTLDALNLTNLDAYHTLTIQDEESGKLLRFPKLIFCDQIEAVTPGANGDPDTIYWLKLADKRWLHWDRGDRITEGYNLRGDTDTGYIASTTNGGTAWTWQQLLNELWPASGFGTAPTLPFTPHGTPEGFWFYRESRMRAVDYLLTRLACALRYDPIDDTFDVVRLGSTTSDSYKAATKASASLTTKRVYDHYPLSPRTAMYPEKIRVQFRVKRPYADGTMPYYTSDVTVSPAASTLGAGTIVMLEDDLTALWDGASITNSSTLTARAAERAADWIRKRQYHDTDELLEYRGLHDLREAVGSLWRECLWYDIGAGGRTRVQSGRVTDTQIEDWQRAEYYGSSQRSIHYYRNAVSIGPRLTVGFLHTTDCVKCLAWGVPYAPQGGGTTYIPYFEARGGTVDLLSCFVPVDGTPTTVGQNVRMAIYANDDDLQQAYPGDLIVDSGNVAINAGNGLYSGSVNVELTAGRLYWLAITWPTDTTLYFFSISEPTANLIGYDPAVETNEGAVLPTIGYYEDTNHSGGFPATAGDVLWPVVSGATNYYTDPFPFAVFVRYSDASDESANWKLIPSVRSMPVT